MGQSSPSNRLSRPSLESDRVAGPYVARCWGMLTWPRRGEQLSEFEHGFWVLGDQAVVSITNFATTLIIGRMCLPEELGLYALGFALVMYLSGVTKAMVWSPYTAFYPKLTSDQQSEYTASATLQTAAIAATTCFGLAVAAVIAQLLFGNPQLAKLFWVLAPAAGLMMIREHVRRLCLAWRDAGEVFQFDVIVCGLQILGLIVLAQTGLLSGTTAYLAALGACFASLGWLYLRRKNLRLRTDQTLSHFWKNWHFAKWLFGGAVVVMAEQALFYWGLSYSHGMAAVGLLAAAQSVIMFANPVILGLANYCGPATAAKLAHQGFRAMLRNVVWSSAAVLGFACVFLVLVILGGGVAVEFLYGATYDGSAAVTVAVALALLARALLMPIELALLAAERSRFLFATAVVRFLLALTIGLPLVFAWGAAGVGYAICIGNLVVLIWEWTVLWRLADDD